MAIIQMPISLGPVGLNRIGVIIPIHWKKGMRVGTFYDPALGMTWIYDRTLKTCSSPEKGWILITEYSKDQIPIAQYYYEPDHRIIFDIFSGNAITPGMSQQEAGSDHISSSVTPETIPVSPLPTEVSQGQIIPAQVNNATDTGGQSCITACSACPSGYCHDCNSNGVCDEDEQGMGSQLTGDAGMESQSASEQPQATSQSTQAPTITITPTPTWTSSGVSEKPQVPFQPTQAPTATITPTSTWAPTGMSEEPQAPIQISLIPDISPGETKNQTGQEGGISEKPQETAFYFKFSEGNGPFAVLACTQDDRCEYCIDENDNQICDMTDCFLILCNNQDECTYCIDCNRDQICDLDKIIVLNCYPDEVCKFIDYWYPLQKSC